MFIGSLMASITLWVELNQSLFTSFSNYCISKGTREENTLDPAGSGIGLLFLKECCRYFMFALWLGGSLSNYRKLLPRGLYLLVKCCALKSQRTLPIIMFG